MALEIEKSIVQVFSDHINYSYNNPWSTYGKEHSTSSGFCIEIPDYKNADKYKSETNRKKYIITNAHCVHNSTHVTLKKRGVSRVYKATVITAIYECDLAILTIDGDFYENEYSLTKNKYDGAGTKAETKASKESKKSKGVKFVNEFYDDMPPLPLGEIPDKLEKVYVYGYPLGGYNISVTKGVVNRVQNIPYYNVVNGIAIQIDATINSGNSGGPVINTKKQVIGVAFAGEDIEYAQNMGYIIPTILIRYVMQTLNYKFTGLCSLGINTQYLENPVLREYYKLDGYQGVLVTSIDPLGTCANILQKNDIIMSIDNIPVYNDGTIRLNDIINISHGVGQTIISDEIVPFNSVVSLKHPGDKINIEIQRNFKSHKITVQAKPKQFLVPILEYQIRPSYYIAAGLIFIPLSIMLIQEKKENGEYVSHLYNMPNTVTVEHEQIIVLSQILRTQITIDFPDSNYILHSINNERVINIKSVHDIIAKNKHEYLTFTFSDTSQVVVLRASDVKNLTREIIEQNLGDIPEFKF